MNKILLTILASLLLAILSACGTVEATNDSQHVTELASKIADFTLPEGYTSEFSAEMAGYTLAFEGKGGPALLVLSESTDLWNDETVNALLASIE